MNPSRSIIAALFVALLLVGCSDESMLTGPDVSPSESQETLTVLSPNTTAPLMAMSKGGKKGKTAICFVPPGQDENSAIVIEVSNAALDRFLERGAWIAPESGDCSEVEDYGDWELWNTDLQNAFPSTDVFQEIYQFLQVSGGGPGFYITWSQWQVRIDIPGVGFQTFNGQDDDVLEQMAKYLGSNMTHDPTLVWGGA